MQVDRFAFSVLWEMTPAAQIVDVSFCKSSIHSKAAMTYAEAQTLLDDDSKHGPIATSVRHLNRIAKLLRCVDSAVQCSAAWLLRSLQRFIRGAVCERGWRVRARV